MEEQEQPLLHKVSSRYIGPMSTVVRTTPPENHRAPKKAEEEKVDYKPYSERKIDIDEVRWLETMKKKVSLMQPQLHLSGSWTIFRAPEYIRQSDPKAYEPLVATVGPYHHNRRECGTDLAIDKHKWWCLQYLLSRYRSQNFASEVLEECLLQLKALDAKVRSCYSEPLCFDPHKLASIMLLDGCFIIHLLLKQAAIEKVGNKVIKREEVAVVMEEDEIEDPLLGMLWIWNLMVYDLLKLENQIPFFIIETLFDLLKTPQDDDIDLPNLALQLFRDVHPNKSIAFKIAPENEIHHLLHLFHSSLIPSQPRTTTSLQCGEAPTPPEWIPSATELKMAGIQFKKNEAAGSFLDVSFKDGIMEIPPLRVYDYTASLFRNLVVFEQCYPDTKTYVTIYSAFMGCIIDAAEDVRLLDLKGIVVNRVSTDEAVADLFNQLCNNIHYASDRNYLADVFTDVKKYHESKWHQWRAGLIRDYFSSPWAGIAVVAAVVLFLLTIEQSFFAAFPP